MKTEVEVILGNAEDLEDFKKHFRSHDRITLNGYYRQARKRQAMMVVRRPFSISPQMQLLVVPYSVADTKGGVLEAIKGKGFRFTGWVQSPSIHSNKVFVFGELLPKNDGLDFKEPRPKSKKTKPIVNLDNNQKEGENV